MTHIWSLCYLVTHSLTKSGYVARTKLKFAQNLSKLLRGFVKLVTCICQVVRCFSSPLPSITKPQFFQNSKLGEVPVSDIELNFLCLLKTPSMQHMGLVWTLFFCAAIQNRFQILTFLTYWQDCDVLREDIDLVIIIKPWLRCAFGNACNLQILW